MSALLWFLWMLNIEYVRARGGVAALVACQTLCVLGVVLAVRRTAGWQRFMFLLLFGQVASIACDWMVAMLLDPVRSAQAIDRIVASPFSARSVLTLLGAGILLGGLQAIFVDIAWRYGILRKN